MRLTEVVKGDPKLADSSIELVCSEQLVRHETYWLVGFGEAPTDWGSPKEITPKAVSYLRGLNSLPKEGPHRLEYFLSFLQHSDELVATDAYNEFAEATLDEIVALSDKLDRGWVIDQLRDVSLPVHRRRLCWTFLSQCGIASDAGLFDELLSHRESDATFNPGMDAAIACYISLRGQDGLARIERDYLANSDAGYTDCFAVVSAIRVHGTELKVLPREQLAAALHHLLERPELSDLVIPDLARWKDWSVIDRVVKLFEEATEEQSFIKSSVVLYLKTCPLPAAARALDRLRVIDAKAVQQAESSMMLYSGLASIPVPPPDEGDAKEDSSGSNSPRVARRPQQQAEISNGNENP